MDAAGQSELIARGRAALAAGVREEAQAAGRALEAACPADEAAWRALHVYFMEIGSTAWADIMTERFLQAAPANVAARMARVLVLANSPTRRDEAAAALADLLALDFTRSPGWQALGDVYERFGQGGALFAALEQALAANPGDVAVRGAIAAHCITHRNLARARAEAAAIRSLAAGNVGVLFTAMQLAQRMGHDAFADETLQEALELVPPDQNATRGWLVLIAAKSGRPDILATLMAGTNFAALDSAAQLAAILQATEGRGFIAQEAAIVARGLALEPGHPALLAASRRAASGAGGLFAGVGAPPAGPRGAAPRMRDRFRALLRR